MNKKQTGFVCEWKKTKVKPAKQSGGFFGPREWQQRAFDKGKDAIYFIVNAPMGSGKTWLICMLTAYRLRKNNKLKAIITVPQTIIASGFEDAKLLLPDGSKVHFCPQHTEDTITDGTVKHIIQFLKSPNTTLNDRILLCTHQAIVAVYKELKRTKQLKLFHNLLCWIDEAHHLKNVEVEGFEDTAVSNGIGEFATYLVRHAKGSHLGLATATLFRGDRLSLLTGKLMSKFERFDLPYDEYMASMQYLKSFRYDFVLCDSKDYTKAFDKILKTSGKDIVHIPSVNSKHSTGCKYSEVQEILKHYKKAKNGQGKPIDEDNGLTLIKRKRGTYKIVDLVDEDRRKEKKEYIASVTEKKDLDSIIALGMFKEGANWLWADRSIIVGPRASLVEVVQIIGRLLRDVEGKEKVQVIHLLPFAVDRGDKDKIKKNLNDYLKAVYASLILENILKPITIISPKKTRSRKLPSVKTDILSSLLDENQQMNLLDELNKTLLSIVDVNESTGFITDLFKEYKNIVPDVLKKYGITENIDEIGNQIWSMFAKRTLTMQGISIEKMSFEALKEVNPLEGLVRYSNNLCNINTLKKFRSILNDFMSQKELEEELRRYVKKHGKFKSIEEYREWAREYNKL